MNRREALAADGTLAPLGAPDEKPLPPNTGDPSQWRLEKAHGGGEGIFQLGFPGGALGSSDPAFRYTTSSPTPAATRACRTCGS